ncbi:J domain-containing protein [Novosphingobium sp. 17-62-19]|uniref:J domain-containing protein n=1 Tax=Novosphingobium sp. 17-62-19 TaxID=1970406 RepID=UPI003450536B
MRHGGLYVVRQTFKGFTALPAPDATSPTNWWTVLGIPRTASRAEIEAAYRDKIRTAHPDTGGTTEAASAINRARDEAFKERTYNV